MNKVILMGRLTRDPDVRYGGENQTAIARFALAVDRRYQQQGQEKQADFFSCTAFGRQAEFVENYLRQGTKILLIGRIQNDNYTNRNGERVYSVQVITEELEFAESKAAAGGQAGNRQQETQQGQRAPQPSPAGDGFMNIPEGAEEELPFI